MELRELTELFTKVVAGAAPGDPVPTCPEWRMRDLVGHIGQAPRWAADLVRSGTPAPVPDPRDATPGPPAEWTAWLLDGADELRDAVAAADRPVWTIVGERPAGWWVRRLRSDLVVHLADACLATGVPYEVPTEAAEDALGEILDLLAHAEFRVAWTGRVTLRAPGGPQWTVSGAGPGAHTTVRGTPPDLLLVLTRRLAVSTVEVDGDPAPLSGLLSWST